MCHHTTQLRSHTCTLHCFFFFFFNDTATTEIYTLSLHDALPICRGCGPSRHRERTIRTRQHGGAVRLFGAAWQRADRKSTRLNSSHVEISYAVFCLKKKKKTKKTEDNERETSDP